MKDMIWRFPTWLLNGVWWLVMHWQYLNTFFPTCIFECSNKDCLWVTGCPYIRWWPSLGAPAGVHHWWPHTVSHCTPHTAVWCPPCWRCALAQWPWCRWLQRARHPFPRSCLVTQPGDPPSAPSTNHLWILQKSLHAFSPQNFFGDLSQVNRSVFLPNNCKIQQKCAKRSLSLQVLSAYMKMTVKPLLQNYHLENLKNIPLSLSTYVSASLSHTLLSCLSSSSLFSFLFKLFVLPFFIITIIFRCFWLSLWISLFGLVSPACVFLNWYHLFSCID